jgi:hypothetical protein
LSSGNWYKIKISKTGVHKLSFEKLQELGFSSPEKVRIYGYGAKQISKDFSEKIIDDLEQVPILKENNHLLFYAEAQYSLSFKGDSISSSTNSYDKFTFLFITDLDTESQNLIESEIIPSEESTHKISSYDNFKLQGKNLLSIYKRGENLFDNSINSGGIYNYKLTLDGKAVDSKLKVKVALAKEYKTNSFVNLSINGNKFVLNDVKTREYNSIEFSKEISINTTELEVEVESINSKCFIDYIAVQMKMALAYNGNQFNFRSFESVGIGQVSEFSINSNSPIHVWNVSDKQSVKNQLLKSTNNGFTFKIATDSLNEFVCFESSKVNEPEYIGEVKNQNLHALKDFDMVIINPKIYQEQAVRLKTFHEDFDGFSVLQINSEKIYNEFSSGRYSAVSIRNFLKNLYQKSSVKPKYVLLMGDGSYNNYLNQHVYLPVFNSQASVDESKTFISDDFYALLEDGKEGQIDSDKTLDLSVGRIPVESIDEAKIVVDKIINYCLNPDYFGAWRNTVCFAADDDDINEIVHSIYAETTANTLENLNDLFNIKKIYLDNYHQEVGVTEESYPEATADLLRTINSGMLLFNFQGHGSPKRLCHETLIDVETIRKLKNKTKLGVWIIGSCDFSPYHEYEERSAGEELILNPNGGAIALISSTKYSFASQNLIISKEFMKVIGSNTNIRVGDVLRMVKNNLSSVDLKDKFVLLGDPALKIKTVDKSVRIKNEGFSGSVDTIKKLELVNLKMEIQENGDVDYNFNGQLNYCLFDVKKSFESLDNENNGHKINYTSQESVLSAGEEMVVDGEFNIKFIVPKDVIFSNMENLKLHVYASDSNRFVNNVNYFKIKGVADYNDDFEGPEIKLYLNDTNFVDGGKTHNKPMLITKLFDPSGLNLTSSSIGHDISLTVDSDYPISLNKYFQADDYSKGVATFSLPKQSGGEHKLSLKAWDVFNNSNESTISYFVGENFEIDNIYLYPNPIIGDSKLKFIHNKNDLLFTSIDFEVFNMLGHKLLNFKRYNILSIGQIVDGVTLSELNKLNIGRYLLKIRLKTEDNNEVNSSLIIVKIK